MPKTKRSLGVVAVLVLIAASVSAADSGRAPWVVFWEPGFPTKDSEPLERTALEQALSGENLAFLTSDNLTDATLSPAQLLILPYGSAFPFSAWPAISRYIQQGGNLLVIGGRPFAVPVARDSGAFSALSGFENIYSRQIGVWRTYEAPLESASDFAWDEDFSSLPAVQLKPRRVFVLAGQGGGQYRGVGYLRNSAGDKVAAPVARMDFLGPRFNRSNEAGSRLVFLCFDPQPGYWSAAAGQTLIRASASQAAQGASLLWLEMQNATVVPGEIPQVALHTQRTGRNASGAAEAQVELLSGDRALDRKTVAVPGPLYDCNIAFDVPLEPGLYTVRASLSVGGQPVESYRTGFWRRDPQLLSKGSLLGVDGDYLSLDGKPFLAFGGNYFSTDWDFTGFWVGNNEAGNGYVWDRDFAEMERKGMNMVRTGVWLNHAAYLDRVTGGVEERFLRAVEGFIHSAGRHGIQVQFTFFGFDPQSIRRMNGESAELSPGSNPYIDPVAIAGQQNYVRTIVQRFKDVPYVSWDLINEPSFSNPKRLWRGNTPNNDPAELAAWAKWLELRYGTTANLARAWGELPDAFGSFAGVPLPATSDLEQSRSGNPRQVRAVDYNLFAQEMFKRWAAEMVKCIRATGSHQLVTVGQDEGGVNDRVLNQFMADSIDFTVNHTWWQDDALFWDSLVAKRPDKPNLIGETAVQPVWRIDGAWRWDELTSAPLIERKLALGLAAANTGSLHWDWAVGDVFGLKRGDGSNKIWMDTLSGMANFGREASAKLGTSVKPQVAIVLPQSLQLSAFKNYALDAQKACVRALYNYARSSAYAVGEYQLNLLGKPKLIILPAPWGLSQPAWESLLSQVRAGATLVVSGRLDADEHLRPTGRETDFGFPYSYGLLTTRENSLPGPAGDLRLTYSGDRTTYLERGFVDGEAGLVERPIGAGRIIYSPLPLELNDRPESIAAVYRYAARQAGVAEPYSTDCSDAGITISATTTETATLYVLTSESSAPREVAFRDAASGATFSTRLAPGRAAMLLVGKDGAKLAGYNF